MPVSLVSSPFTVPRLERGHEHLPSQQPPVALPLDFCYYCLYAPAPLCSSISGRTNLVAEPTVAVEEGLAPHIM